MYRSAASKVFWLIASVASSLLFGADSLRAGGPLPNVVVNGVVRDGSGHQWPLYAKVEVSGPGFSGGTFTDPVNGYYAIALPPGATYGVTVTSLVPGYVVGGGSLTLPPAPAATVVASWSLAANPSCMAPGYGPGAFAGPLALSEGFDGGVIPAGWSVETSNGVSWKVYTGGDPCFQFDGNRTGGSGPYAIVNSGCETMFTNDDTYLVAPPIDLSSRTSAAIQWANDFIDLQSGSRAAVEVSADGGLSWTEVWSATADLPGPGVQIADISPAAGHADVSVRFHYQGFFSYWWQVDDVKVGTFACGVVPGGLVVGAVSDGNSGAGLNGAAITNPPGGTSAISFGTPDDPAQPDGFYALAADGGPGTFAASFSGYETATRNTTVIPNAAVRLDFSLAAGLLDASPRPVTVFVGPGVRKDVMLTLTNSGGADADYVVREIDLPPTEAPAESPRPRDAAARAADLRRIPFSHRNDRSLAGYPRPANAPSAPRLAGAGNVVASFPTGLAAGWGLVYDTSRDHLWISNPDAPDFGFAGDGFEHEYTAAGVATGGTIDIHGSGGAWQADGAFNARTGMLWQANVGGDYCLFEMDPVAKAVTGRKLCGPWPVPQRAVAYDYATDTYYTGGPSESTLYHVDAAGHLLGSQDIGIAMVGLAYNPTTRHLFAAIEGSAPPFDVWVFDAAHDYTPLGGIVVGANGSPIVQEGVSLESACNGDLFITDEATQTVYEFQSGESGWCVDDIPWLSETPDSGTVAGSGGTLPITLTFDTQGLLPGLRQRSLLLDTRTPTAVEPLPVDFTVLFNDVPQGSFLWNYIYGAAGAGVMPGCAPQTPTFQFCPAQIVTRRTMASYLERGVHGAQTPPPVYLDGFGDVEPGSFNADYIQGLLEDGITTGCSAEPALYCPDAPVTRAQMAVFIWRSQHGSEAPPSCAGLFLDVACPGNFAADYIEAIAAEGITNGCGGGYYCPNSGITNAQAAVFLVRAFGLAYLP